MQRDGPVSELLLAVILIIALKMKNAPVGPGRPASAR